MIQHESHQIFHFNNYGQVIKHNLSAKTEGRVREMPYLRQIPIFNFRIPSIFKLIV